MASILVTRFLLGLRSIYTYKTVGLSGRGVLDGHPYGDDASITGNIGAPVKFGLDDDRETQPYISENPLLSGLKDTALRIRSKDSQYVEFDIPSVIDIKP